MADLTTLATLKERLGITGSNPSDVSDAYLENVIDRSTALIEGWVGRVLVQSGSITEYHSGIGTPYLFLNNGPAASITSVSSVVYDTSGNETATAEAAGNYFLWAPDRLPSYLEYHGSSWVYGQRNYKVVYTMTHSSTVPEDLEEACLALCVFQKNKRKDVATSARAIGDGSLDGLKGYDEIPAEIMAMLSPWKPED